MKIEIEVPEGDVGKSIVEVLNHLSYDDKKAIARQVIKDWLENATSKSEREVYAQKQVEILREEHKRDHYHREMSDKEIRESWQFRERMQRFKSSHDILIEETVKAVGDFYKQQVEQVVRENPRLQAVLHDVSGVVKENLPKAVHDAMVAWFLEHMRGILQGVGDATLHLGGIEEFKATVHQRLEQMGGRGL